MLVSLNWLKNYVNIDIETQEFGDKMTMSGSKVEMISEMGKEVKGVVIGLIEKIERHPDADKLVVTKVNTGEMTLQIVTGATNIKEGDYIPVAVHGAQLPGGVKIKKGKLRGEVSEGMLCSMEELGIAKAMIPEEMKDGIWILDREYPLGSNALEVLGLMDEVVEFEITSNRPDCLSMIGMAREAGATLNQPIQYPTVQVQEVDEKAAEHIQVSIEDEEGCLRYVAKVIKDVKIGPSPLWMQQRLMKAGVRPINNIVDITNYVMLEYGQPLHAFDLSYIAGKKITVRKAEENESMKTLDGVERKLSPAMTVIADGEKALAVAGVMGGEESEVTSNTQCILLESANFDADSIRLTSKTLGLRTEASSRYEKGVDPNIAEVAANRACQLIVELGVGKVLSGAVDVYPREKSPEKMTIRSRRMNELLGTNLKQEEMKEILEKLEMTTEIAGENLEVTIPTFRFDLSQEADFVEEIGRIYGYDRIQPTMARGNIVAGGKSAKQKVEDVAKQVLNAMGLNEILTYSFVSPKSVEKINLPEESIKRSFVKLLNPLGDETSVMRTSLLPNLLEVLARNMNRKVEEAKAYEMGNIFITQQDEDESLPREIPSLAIGIYGEENFFTLKGIVEKLLEWLGIEGYEFAVEKFHPTYHPGRCANVLVGDQVIGTLGEIHPVVGENYSMNKKCYCAELDFSLILQLTRLNRLYQPLPKYPAITRDFAVVVTEQIMVKDIEDIIKSQGGSLLESYQLFDVYKGNQIAEGFKSIAYTITYRHRERTLTDQEVNEVHEGMIATLNEKLGATLRE